MSTSLPGPTPTSAPQCSCTERRWSRSASCSRRCGGRSRAIRRCSGRTSLLQIARAELRRNLVGFPTYVAVTAVGLVAPKVSLAGFAALALFYLLPDGRSRDEAVPLPA